MKSILKFKLLVVIAVFIWAVWVTFPQFIPQKAKQRLPSWVANSLSGEKLSLGLDLQGGVHLVLGLDLNRVIHESYKRNTSSVIQAFDNESIAYAKHALTQEDDDFMFRLDFETSEDKKTADKYLEKNFPLLLVDFEESTALLLKLDPRELTDIRQKTIQQSIEVLQNRIDEFGVKEPIIAKIGDDRIQVQFPGLTETDRIKSIISRTAKLEFRMVNTELSTATLQAIVDEAHTSGVTPFEGSGVSLTEYTEAVNTFAKDRLPDGHVVRFERSINDRTQEVSYEPRLVVDNVPLTGLNLQDARVSTNPDTQLPEVNIRFNPTGTKIFGDLTKANVGKQMAIILDDLINSAPVIRQAITGGSAVITLGTYADFSKLYKEASDLVVVLRAGSLPTTLEFLEERTVGPSLGSDSIKAGTFSALIGGFIVLIFMVLYYSSAGLLAAFALLFNALLLLTLLTSLGATLTLPGIAGIVLTFGMSVDANIIIFERIRENLLRGRNVASAVMGGYEKALITILDANITTIFAGIILLQYGTGAIKGFAVTLILGILTSLFTAYFAAKQFSEWMYNRPDRTNIRIGIPWQKKPNNMRSSLNKQTPVHPTS